MVLSTGMVRSVNVGRARTFDYKGRTAASAIWKYPVSGPVPLRGVNFDGDEQADRTVHGGPDKAVYSYSVEDYGWWGEQLGRSPEFGEFGENLTTEGLNLSDALVGEQWEVGTTVLEVSEPRMPCWKLAARMSDPTFPRLFTKASRPGTYLRIVKEGEIGEGDEIRVISRPEHDLSVGDVFRIYAADRHEAGRLLEVPEVSDSWKLWAGDWLARTAERETARAEPGCC
ncbi:MAG: MOSC domain-containing protein [Gemmatimonadota bacterium]